VARRSGNKQEFAKEVKLPVCRQMESQLLIN